MVEYRNGIVHRRNRPIINLLEVCLALADLHRVNVKGDRVLGQPERVQTGVGLVHLLLEVQRRRRNVAQFSNCG